jgi:hypothetical protein
VSWSHGRRAALGLLLLVAAGCSGPQGTISQLGQPAFEPILGATVYELASEEPQPKGFDAFDPATVQDDADHRLALSFLPMADEEQTAIEIRAQVVGGLPLRDLAAAVYPATRANCQAFESRGALPEGAPIFTASDSKATSKGRVLTMIFPRSSIPAGTLGFAIPILLRFEDGWIRVQYYQTAVPEPLRRESPEAAEARAKEELRAALDAKRAAEAEQAEPATPQDPN